MDSRLEISEEERRARIEHRNVLLDIQAVLVTKPGKNFIKYLLLNFNAGAMPPLGLTGELLHENLGLHRCGEAIFKIVAAASPEMAGQILAQIEKEKYEQAQSDQRE